MTVGARHAVPLLCEFSHWLCFMTQLKNYFILPIFFVVDVLGAFQAHSQNEIQIDFQGRPQRVTYDYYIPPKIDQKNPLPFLVCIGGLPMEGDRYIQSDTHECFDETWFKFAKDNQMAILGLGFFLSRKIGRRKPATNILRSGLGKPCLRSWKKSDRNIKSIPRNYTYLGFLREPNIRLDLL